MKPVFSNADPMGDKLILIEDGEVVSDDKIIAECLNTQLVNITNSLGLNLSFKNNETDFSMEESIDIAIAKYNNHPSIAATGKKLQVYQKFEFSNVDLLNTLNKVEALHTRKARSGNIPIRITRDAKEVISP